MSEKIDVSGYTADGRPVIEMPARENYGSGMLSDPAFKVQRAIGDLRKSGYTVPVRLATWVDNVAAAKRVPAAPVPPAATADGYAEKLEAYVAAYALHESRVAALGVAVDAAKGELRDVVRASVKDVLADKKLRKEFESAAAEYRSAALALRGVDSIAAAANADLDGRTVAAWHQRTAAGRRLSAIVDILKRLLDPMMPFGFDTRTILGFVTERPEQWLANAVRDQLHVPDVCRRWEALVQADRRFELMVSTADLADRLERGGSAAGLEE